MSLNTSLGLENPILNFLNCFEHSSTGLSWAGGQAGSWPLPYFLNHRIFANINVSSENFHTLAVGKDKGFELYRKIFELGPPILQMR